MYVVDTCAYPPKNFPKHSNFLDNLTYPQKCSSIGLPWAKSVAVATESLPGARSNFCGFREKNKNHMTLRTGKAYYFQCSQMETALQLGFFNVTQEKRALINGYSTETLTF